MAKKQKLVSMTEEALSRIDRGDHLWHQLHDGTSIAEPELADRIEVLRHALYETLARMSDYWNYDSEEGIKKLRTLAMFAHHFRQCLAICISGDMRGLEVPEEQREYWMGPLESDPFKSLLERHEKPKEGDSVH